MEANINALKDWLLEENVALLSGKQCVAGIDEAGRGALAGPVVAACVVLPANCIPDNINDSKLLSAKQRQVCYLQIMDVALGVGIGIVESSEIDRINILKASHEAMRIALRNLPPHLNPDLALIDGLPVRPFPLFQKAIVKGDSKSASIAAASIIAKVTRDKLLVQLHQVHPQYGFARHKGYGTAGHVHALRTFGACVEHRRSFRPVREWGRLNWDINPEQGELPL